LDYQEEKVEVSYQVISEIMGIVTVAVLMDKQLLHIIAGKKDFMISTLEKLFK
jgi:hypothetical protein